MKSCGNAPTSTHHPPCGTRRAATPAPTMKLSLSKRHHSGKTSDSTHPYYLWTGCSQQLPTMPVWAAARARRRLAFYACAPGAPGEKWLAGEGCRPLLCAGPPERMEAPPSETDGLSPPENPSMGSCRLMSHLTCASRQKAWIGLPFPRCSLLDGARMGRDYGVA